MSLPFIFTVMNQKILRLAVPNIISNISVPLLSMVDLAIVGHMGSISFIGAIGVAGVVFNFIYWNFGFLRMGTTGFTAQSYGARDLEKAVETLVRSAVVAIGISLILILLQKWILQFSLIFIDVTEATKEPIKQYFYIRIWSAPCVLLLYTFKGWFLGMQNSRFPMIIAIVTNILNIGFSLLFVYAFQMDFKGVALGTVVAEYSGLLLAVTFWLGYYGKLKKYINWSQVLIKDKLLQFFKVNSNIFLRTFCLIIVFTSFTTFSTKSGDTILAVNTLLLQLFTLFSYIMDGFAYAAESLTGKFVGGKNKPQLKMTIQYVFRWGWVLTFLFTILYYFFGDHILQLLTDNQAVLEASKPYFKWVLLVPVSGFAAFLWDGIFVGATASKAMRDAIFIATAGYFALYFILHPIIGNNGLWIALLLFLALRGIGMKLMAKKVLFS